MQHSSGAVTSDVIRHHQVRDFSAMDTGRDEATLEDDRVDDHDWRKLYNGGVDDDADNDNDVFVDHASCMFSDVQRSAFTSYPSEHVFLLFVYAYGWFASL